MFNSVRMTVLMQDLQNLTNISASYMERRSAIEAVRYALVKLSKVVVTHPIHLHVCLSKWIKPQIVWIHWQCEIDYVKCG